MAGVGGIGAVRLNLVLQRPGAQLNFPLVRPKAEVIGFQEPAVRFGQVHADRLQEKLPSLYDSLPDEGRAAMAVLLARAAEQS